MTKAWTYDSYRELLEEYSRQDYRFLPFCIATDHGRHVLMRHDVDHDLGLAARLAEIDADLDVCSTFFLMVSGPYNVAAEAKKIGRILRLGHHLGLHFDPSHCTDRLEADAAVRIQVEFLESVTGETCRAMSLHRPTRGGFLIRSPVVINAYDPRFLPPCYRYVSDSLQCWRQEPLPSDDGHRVHLLTHEYCWSDDGQHWASVLRRLADQRWHSEEVLIAEYEKAIEERDQRDLEFRRMVAGS